MNTHRLTEEPSNRLPSPKRAVAAVATALGLALLAACGGGGGGGAQPGSAPGLVPTTSGQPVVQTSTAPTATPSPGATYVPTITTSGTVLSVNSGYFVLSPPAPHGRINVYTTASTQYIGAKPFAGESISLNVTGAWGQSFTAIWIAQAGFATPTPVAAPTPAATSTPVVITNVPVHIPTWAFDEFWAMGANASSSAVQQYVTYAEGGYGNSKAQQDCNTSPKSCHSVAYIDPNLVYADTACPHKPDTTILSAASESWFVHQAGYSDAAHRAQGSYTHTCNGASDTLPVYLMNQTDPNYAAWYKSYIQQNLDNWDYYWLDVTKVTVAGQAFGPGGSFCPGVSACSTTQEYPNDSSVVSAHISFADSLTHANGSPLQVFFNSLTFNAGTLVGQVLLQQDPSHFNGGVCENCVVNGGVFQPANYVNVLNGMLQVNTIPNAQFVQLDTGSSPSGSAAQISQRVTALAIAWLGYSDGHTVVFPNFEDNTQNLGVWPEDLVYPAAPVQTMQWSANDIAVAGGVYRREFRQCFYNQQAIGPCAAIVNANSSAVTVASSWLTQTYAHQIAVSGGDVTNGGTLSTTSTAFTPNVTTIASGQAILLAQ